MFSFCARIDAVKLQPSFFDIFGAVGFLVIIGIAVKGLANPDSLPEWMLLVLLFIGIVGFLVDSVIVYRTYLKR